MNQNTIVISLAVASDLVDFKLEGLVHDRIRLDLVYPGTHQVRDIIADVVEKLSSIEPVAVVGFNNHHEIFNRWNGIFIDQINRSTSLHDLRHRLHIDGPLPDCNYGSASIHFFGSMITQLRLKNKNSEDTVHEHYDIGATDNVAIELSSLGK